MFQFSLISMYVYLYFEHWSFCIISTKSLFTFREKKKKLEFNCASFFVKWFGLGNTIFALYLRKLKLKLLNKKVRREGAVVTGEENVTLSKSCYLLGSVGEGIFCNTLRHVPLSIWNHH